MSGHGSSAVFLQLTEDGDCTAEKAAMAAIAKGAKGVVVSAAPGRLPHPAGVKHVLAWPLVLPLLFVRKTMRDQWIRVREWGSGIIGL